jgi:hypothetical protein
MAPLQNKFLELAGTEKKAVNKSKAKKSHCVWNIFALSLEAPAATFPERVHCGNRPRACFILFIFYSFTTAINFLSH